MKEIFRDIQNENHCVVPLFAGADSLISRTLLLREATSSCDIMTFLWRNDNSGNFYLEECKKAARRGVALRVLIDYWAPSTTKNSILGKMLEIAKEEKNFSVKLFNPVANNISPTDTELLLMGLPNFKTRNRRMHGKIQIVDGDYSILGGRNIGDEYFDSHEVRSFLDFEVIYTGIEQKHILQSFENFWTDEIAVDLKNLQESSDFPNIQIFQSEEVVAEGGEITNSVVESLEQPEPFLKKLSTLKCYPRSVEFINDAPDVLENEPRKSGEKAEKLMLSAQSELHISTPYLIPPVDLIKKFSEKDLKLSICTNSLVTADNLFTYAAAIRLRDLLFKKLNIQLHELKNKPEDIEQFISTCGELEKRREGRRSEPKSGFGSNKYETKDLHCTLHAKYFVVDRTLSCIGAMNFDSRSLYHNTETLLVIEDKEFALKLLERHELIQKSRNSWVIAPLEERTDSGEILEMFDTLLDLKALKDKWVPLQTSSFDARTDAARDQIPCPRQSTFYDSYESVGMFPGVNEPDTDVQVFLFKQLSIIFGNLL